MEVEAMQGVGIEDTWGGAGYVGCGESRNLIGWASEVGA